MTIVYGIPNCDTVKKARAWLAGNGVDYEFSDFKKTPPDAALIESWLRDIPLATLLNKRGTTWRKLSTAEQAEADSPEGAVRLMTAHPSIIKRPVLCHNGRCYAGFQTTEYEQVFR
ncbi:MULTISPECIES: arsenate reductase [unclassified Neisseria]|uniref:arsenate reductase n=1 Tax=unclassified Neisseria TaxID=2623750 RepID=UPI0010725852|nr:MULTISPECIES: arsenate reductase [unclassified Neisseria]MBF0803233.1 arsenate reductase [Neisseria sp. 19428wB4_WF04]TFU44073.1 arsenate reductase [Neisseria sp. WF04]